MKANKLLFTLISVFFISGFAYSQDKLYKKNQEVIECKIKEIGTDYVKYTLPDYPDDVLFSIDTDKLRKAEFANGQEKYFIRELTNPENYADNKKNAIKVDFISPLTGNTTFAYERSLKPGRSIEATLGIIGLGINIDDLRQSGMFAKFGYKFLKSPDYYFNKMRYSHILKGSYVRPEIAFAYYSYNTQPDYWGGQAERKQVFSGAIHLILGKQWIFDDAFLVDFFVGIGYGFSDAGEAQYSYGYVVSDPSVPISATAGLRIGMLFK
jgi:hypothetical protein